MRVVGNRGLPADLRLIDHAVQVKSGDEAGIDVEILRRELIALARCPRSTACCASAGRSLAAGAGSGAACRSASAVSVYCERRGESKPTSSSTCARSLSCHVCTTASRLSVASLPRRLKPSSVGQHAEDQDERRDRQPRPFAAVDPVENQVVERTDQRDVERQKADQRQNSPAADRSPAEFPTHAPPIPNRRSRLPNRAADCCPSPA